MRETRWDAECIYKYIIYKIINIWNGETVNSWINSAENKEWSTIFNKESESLGEWHWWFESVKIIT